MLLMITLAASLSACSNDAPPYFGTLEEWQRDSAIVDSISRGVQTDSLYHAYRAALSASDLQQAHQKIVCFELELRRRHGNYPALLAIDRMKDTVWNGIDPSLVRAHDERAPAAMSMRGDSETCGWPESLKARNDRLPEAVGNVDPRHRPRDLR